jgi:hypothetical protein
MSWLRSQIRSSELQGDYVATRDELEIIDSAIASIDAGVIATDSEVAAAFANFARNEGSLFATGTSGS